MQPEYTVYRSRWVVLAIFMYMIALSQFYWLNLAAIETYVEEFLKIPASTAMWFSLVFPVLLIILTIPAGIIIDKIGFKWGVGIGAMFVGVGALLRVIDPSSFVLLLIGQIGIAIGQPFVLNGTTKVATEWFSPKEEGTAIGLASLAQFVGLIVALGLTPVLVENSGFANMLLIFGIAGIVGTLAFLLIPKQPPTPARAIEEDQSVAQWGGIGVILKNRNFVMLGFVALGGIGAFSALSLWVEKILHEMHSIPMTDAGGISAVMILSGMVGCFVMPFLSDRLKRRKPFLILATIMATTCLIAMIFAQDYMANLINGIMLGFLWLSALPIMLTMSAEITGSKYAGVSVGWIMLLGNVATLVLGAAMEGLRGITGQFVAPLLLLAVLMAGTFFVALWIKETYPQT